MDSIEMLGKIFFLEIVYRLSSICYTQTLYFFYIETYYKPITIFT